jgi:hypothetical protein
MNLRSRVIVLLATFSLTVLPIAADTRIVHRWVLTGLPMPDVQKSLSRE